MSKENRPEKNGFLLYKTQWEPIFELDDDDLGKLMRAIFEYQIEGTEPPKKSPIAAYFKFFKAQFSIDEGGYQVVVEKRRLAGIASAEAKKKAKEEAQQTATKSTHVESVEQNQHTATNATKSTDKEKENDNGKENVNDNGKGNETSKEVLGVGGLSLSKNFDQKITAWAEIWGTIGTRRKTETAYIEAVKMIMGDGGSEIDAHNALGRGAAADRSFCIAVGRKRQDPHTWLANRGWERDYTQELNSHKEIQNHKTQVHNGKSDHKTTARDYADAARDHARWVESQTED